MIIKYEGEKYSIFSVSIEYCILMHSIVGLFRPFYLGIAADIRHFKFIVFSLTSFFNSTFYQCIKFKKLSLNKEQID